MTPRYKLAKLDLITHDAQLLSHRVAHTDTRVNKREVVNHEAQPRTVSKGPEFPRISEAVWNRSAVCAGPVPLALAQRVRLSAVRSRGRVLRDPHQNALSV
jgi:hypothetical protein